MPANRLPSKIRMQTLVSLGCVFISLGALDALDAVRVPLVHFLIRHMRGDWGRLSDEDWQRNEQANATGEYLLSSYVLSSGQKIWIQTTCGRSATVVLLPAEESRLERSLNDTLHGC
ncbi:Type I restriction-modification system methyltransferase subunit [Burkholderia pseudomallei]|nr:Type I restriction-modification system methyltransferase subunit [Burkholderia pseudomallei]CAJ8197285.1 Type I restriction-modification system methyltransferase subunit [Burkholderia pseudomallei]